MTGTPGAADYFGGLSGRYDSHYDGIGADGHALRARMAAVLGLLGDGPGAVLDAGMGPGRLCAELSARGWTVSGIDASPEMVAAARERLPGEAERLQQSEIEQLPFPDGGFDAVAATGVLEYADLSRALAELARVLRPGGVAVVSYPNPRAAYGVWKTQVWYRAIRILKRLLGRSQHWLPRGGRPLPPECFTPLLEAAGLELAELRHTSYLVVPTPLEILLPRLSARLGLRFEGSGPRVARLLATQVVYKTRKPG